MIKNSKYYMIYIYNVKNQRNIIYLKGHAYKIIVKVKLCMKMLKISKLKTKTKHTTKGSNNNIHKKILNKYLEILFHHGKIIQHHHDVYIIEYKPKLSQNMPNSFRINNVSSTVQDHQHVVRIGAFAKQILKQYLECELNCKKFQGTFPTCLVYHPHGQTIIQGLN